MLKRTLLFTNPVYLSMKNEQLVVCFKDTPDEKHTCEILNTQIRIGEVLKKNLWKQTVEAKIKNQSKLLTKLGKDGDVLKPYYCNPLVFVRI